jgi:hypothetical protein
MQQQSHDFTRSHSKMRFTPSEAELDDFSNSTAYHSDSASAYGEQEQRQAYTAQAQEYEHSYYNDSDEDGGSMDRHWEKATSYPRRKAHKGWWAIVAMTALLIFMLGTSMNMWAMPGMKSMTPPWRDSFFSRHSIAARHSHMWPPVEHPQMWPPAHDFSFFMNPTFTSIATNEVANALHLTPEQITTKIVNANYGLSAVAADQGIVGDGLYSTEQKAINDMLDAEIKAGYISSEEAAQWKNLFWNDPGKLDNVVGSMFSGFPVDISY